MAKQLNKLYLGENGKAVRIGFPAPPPERVLVGNRYDTSVPALLRVWQEATKFPDGSMWICGQSRCSKASLFTINFIVPVLHYAPINAIPVWPVDETPGGIADFGLWFLQGQTETYAVVNIAGGLSLDQTWLWEVRGFWKD